MWAGKDNGKDVSWHKAMKYCRDLRLAGYSDWRLATLGELKGIYDKNANAPGRDGQGASTWHVKGNLFLTGNQWSSSQRMDDRGKPSGYAWRFDFNEGRSFGGDELWFYTFKRALCVRGPEKKECSARPPLGAVGAVQRRGDNAAQNLLQGAAEHQYGQLEATGPPRR